MKFWKKKETEPVAETEKADGTAGSVSQVTEKTEPAIEETESADVESSENVLEADAEEAVAESAEADGSDFKQETDEENPHEAEPETETAEAGILEQEPEADLEQEPDAEEAETEDEAEPDEGSWDDGDDDGFGELEYISEDEFEDAEDPDEDEDVEDDEETKAQKALRRHKRRKTAAIVFASIVAVLAAAYFGMAFFFESHFMPFTTINGTDFSMKSVAQVEDYMKQQVADYEITLEESDGGSETITGESIGLKYVAGEELKELVQAQEKFLWVKSLWENPELTAPIGVEYDEEAFEKQIDQLECMDKENQVKSENARPEFKETEFVIVPEVIGTEIDREIFAAALSEAVNGFQPSMNLSEKGCYVLPKYVSDSEEVIKARDSMNKYLKATITYDVSPETEVVDASVISKWVKVNSKMKVTFSKKAVKKYIKSLAEKYDTLGNSRQFTTAKGNTVKVTGGYYGWKIDQDAEYKALISDIKKGKAVEREPKYSVRAKSHGASDIGDTYAEVDLTNQHMYFTKNGKVVLDSPIVTGNPNRGNATPAGTYSLTYKTRNAVLRGAKKPDGTYEYESPVAYWMPFNGGIGFHDATWQSSFGGERYKTNGSHGCVNMPKDKAAKLYELLPEKCPVICYH